MLGLPGISKCGFPVEQVMQTLKDLANEGKTVVCSIHQPRSSIFSMFDDLLLLSEGQIVYSGPAKGVISHFESLVRPSILCPHALILLHSDSRCICKCPMDQRR